MSAKHEKCWDRHQISINSGNVRGNELIMSTTLNHYKTP